MWATTLLVTSFCHGSRSHIGQLHPASTLLDILTAATTAAVICVPLGSVRLRAYFFISIEIGMPLATSQPSCSRLTPILLHGLPFFMLSARAGSVFHFDCHYLTHSFSHSALRSLSPWFSLF